MTFVDPPEAPEGGSAMRAKDLVNKVCLFQPVSLGEWPAKAAEYDENGTMKKPAQKASEYVECNVWVLDRAGVLEEGTGVRVGWWKAVAQLREGMFQYVGAKPKTEEGSNAIHLVPLEGAAREMAAKIVAELSAAEPGETTQFPAEDGEEPF